jgi:hypothetical protein
MLTKSTPVMLLAAELARMVSAVSRARGASNPPAWWAGMVCSFQQTSRPPPCFGCRVISLTETRPVLCVDDAGSGQRRKRSYAAPSRALHRSGWAAPGPACRSRRPRPSPLHGPARALRPGTPRRQAHSRSPDTPRCQAPTCREVARGWVPLPILPRKHRTRRCPTSRSSWTPPAAPSTPSPVRRHRDHGRAPASAQQPHTRPPGRRRSGEQAPDTHPRPATDDADSLESDSQAPETPD